MSGAATRRWVDPANLVCPGCGEQVSCEPPSNYLATAGAEIPRFSHRDGSPLCGHPDAWVEPVERETNSSGSTRRYTARVDTSASTGGEGGFSAVMVAALERAWAAIRVRHPDLPAVVLVVGAGSTGGRNSGLKLGQFAAMRWHHGSDQLPEVFIGGEGLARGPVEVLGTLLHEAAHALAHVRQIKDTSRQGRWHNTRFKALADEVGIQTSKDPRIGWSPTTVPDRTQRLYVHSLDQLGAALGLYRASEPLVAGGKTTTPPCLCACGRRSRVAPSVLADGPITCGICHTPFQPDQEADQP
jgi:hypothetical protein